MKFPLTSLLTLSCLVLSTPAFSQSYFGLRSDNYSGIHGVLLNPAELGNSRMSFEINAASASLFLSNDYLTVDVSSDLIDDFEGLWEDAVIRDPKDNNRLNANVDIVGPSLMFRTGKKSGVAFSTRVRGLYRIDNFSGQLLEGIQNNFDPFTNFDLAMENHQSFLHSYLEAGFSYGTVVHTGTQSQLKVGGAVKYLQGLGASYTASESLSGGFNDNNDRINISGDFLYGSTTDYDFEEISFDQLTTGFGFDAGISFEWFDEAIPASNILPAYRVKVGASLTDIGSISYETGVQSSYLVSGSLPASDVEGETVEYILEDNYDGQETNSTVKASLPTSLNLMADVRVAGKLYVSAVMNKSMASDGELFSSSFPTVVAVTPRFQTKALGLYTPIVFGGNNGPTMGAGLRFWIITVGSGSLLTDLVLGDNPYSTDVYVGVKLPFYRRHKPNTQDLKDQKAARDAAKAKEAEKEEE